MAMGGLMRGLLMGAFLYMRYYIITYSHFISANVSVQCGLLGLFHDYFFLFLCLFPCGNRSSGLYIFFLAVWFFFFIYIFFYINLKLVSLLQQLAILHTADQLVV